MQRSTLSSAEQVAGSTDILWEILLRMPPKPLGRFNCVSKHWLSLISHRQFRHLHTLRHHHHHALPSLLLSHHSTPSSSSSSSSPLPCFMTIPLTATSDDNAPSEARYLNLGFLNRPHVSVVRSCNGLLLCHAGPTTYFVCNPTTNEFVSLTLPDRPFMNRTRAVYLAFDPSKSQHFRVVLIRMIFTQGSPGSCRCECNVYSPETSAWSPPASCFTAPREVIATSGVYFNGAIHWFNEGDISVYFDVDTRRLKSFPMPLLGADWCKRSVEYFGESKGRLHLILGKTGRNLEFDVFELKEDYSLWSLKHHIDLNFARVELPELSWGLAKFVLPFYIVCQEKEGSSMLVLLLGGTAISYDPVSCTLRKLCDFEPVMTEVDAVACYMSGEIFQYFESLSLVGVFRGH